MGQGTREMKSQEHRETGGEGASPSTDFGEIGDN